MSTTKQRTRNRVPSKRPVRLRWKSRVTLRRKAKVLHAVRKFYPQARDDGKGISLTFAEHDLRFVWMFMLTGDFVEIEQPTLPVRLKTQCCEDCKFREWVGLAGLKCTKGHKPRFYHPPNGDVYAENWGWRRRCADFQTGEHVCVIEPNQKLSQREPAAGETLG